MKAIIFLSLLTAGFSASAALVGLSCQGTEPFYAVDISVADGTLTFTEAISANAQTFKVSGPMQAAGMQDNLVMNFKGKTDDISAVVLADTLAGQCSDGMSDNVYPFHLVYTQGDHVYYGCCEPKAQD